VPLAKQISNVSQTGLSIEKRRIQKGLNSGAAA
jgi:hypothetical protein